MTTEDDFQAALDADPSDWQTRVVFADWLDERGDSRAEGYRALGKLRKIPKQTWFNILTKDGLEEVSTFWYWMTGGEWWMRSCLDIDWHAAFELSVGSFDSGSPDDKRPLTRRQCDDHAARAFATLSSEVKSELLALT